ncbi:hypothetical protein NU688_33690 [Variovorax sp. ZS18.2.2]|uniref:hypothetical protein n=1 Tax=Variovorax sp. ZS18.2.2 TaxID=2971255 RepID=UPI0021519047|nr:hypothetical protein [Variovorax sp. ZS18.2.2]MCR6481152.1 hypothetical protein [Variovorax sp. ZS18.2.2]
MTPEQKTETRLFVLQRAIMALINTHPNPREFAKAFSSFTAQQQVDQAAFAKSSPEVRAESAEFAGELIEWAVRVADAKDSAGGGRPSR